MSLETIDRIAGITNPAAGDDDKSDKQTRDLLSTNAWGVNFLLNQMDDAPVDQNGHPIYSLITSTRGGRKPQVDTGSISTLEASLSAREKNANRFSHIFAKTGSLAIIAAMFTVLDPNLNSTNLHEYGVVALAFVACGVECFRKFDRLSRVAVDSHDKLIYLNNAVYRMR